MDKDKDKEKYRGLGLLLILAAVLCLLIGWYVSFYEKETGPFATGSILAALLLLPGFYLLGGGQVGFFGRQVFYKINLDEADAEGNRVPQILDGKSGTVDATVLGVSRSLRLGADTGMSYFLICRYTDPQTARPRTSPAESWMSIPAVRWWVRRCMCVSIPGIPRAMRWTWRSC